VKFSSSVEAWRRGMHGGRRIVPGDYIIMWRTALASASRSADSAFSMDFAEPGGMLMIRIRLTRLLLKS